MFLLEICESNETCAKFLGWASACHSLCLELWSGVAVVWKWSLLPDAVENRGVLLNGSDKVRDAPREIEGEIVQRVAHGW